MYFQKSIFPKVEDEEVDEKIQMLISNVKQKSELIKEILENTKEWAYWKRLIDSIIS